MYIATIPNRSSPPAILLRESFREHGKVKNRTLANLSGWSRDRVEALREVLRGRVGAPAAPRATTALEIVRSWPHGHVAAVLGTVRRLDLERLVARAPSTARALGVAMLVHRLLAPGSKLALARRHLQAGQLVLYDVTSTYFEGRRCPLAKRGHSRDGKRDTLQIVFGVLTNAAGCPVAVEVFDGNTGDPKTLTAVLTKVRQRFGLERLILVGDRGMLTAARIREELAGVAGLAWITALRAPAIHGLVQSGALQLSLFDQQDLAEITHPDYPGERLIVCKNPLLAADRARKRQELLAATERDLAGIATAVQRAQRPLRGAAAIGLRVGKVLGRYKVGKHFTITIRDQAVSYQRDEVAIAAEAALDGLYVIRTNVPVDAWPASETVRAYKRLAEVERTFRSLKTVDLHVRPIHHRTANRVRAHVFLCLLAYYVEWHMRQALKPLLFDD